MSGDDDWGDIDSLPKKRSGPKLLFCAAGCLLPLLALVALISWGVATFREGRDSDSQWAALALVLPHEGRPEGWQLVFGFQPGLLSFAIGEQVYFFTDAAEPSQVGERTIVLVWTDEDVGSMFDAARDEVEPYVPPAAEGEEPGDALETLRVQGRDLRVSLLSGHDEPGAGLFGFGRGPAPDEVGPALALDLTAPGAQRNLVLIAHAKDGPLSAEELLRFLAPFEVGPER